MMLRALFLILTFFASSQVHSADFRGAIMTLATGPNLGDYVYVKVENHSSAAIWSTTCATDGYWSFKFNINTPGSKEAYSLLLSAFVAGKKVIISGTGECVGEIGDDIQNLGYTRFDI